ncbi:MAG: hypothetical protein EA424_03265 [Planctomycetaceae bacterium]|nr:MAG: hypothetical protein EA424_03265 [Planctomycetaceae bacterium]
MLSRSPENQQKMTVSLAEILPALTDAVNSDRAWLEDFIDDPVVITTDLYEVLLVYQDLRSTA